MILTRLLRPLSTLLIGLLFGTALPAQNQITLEDVSLASLAPTPGVVSIDTDAPAASVFLSITFDPLLLEAGAINAIGVAAAAEGVFPNLFQAAGGLVCGVILDVMPPFDGQTIAPGVDLPVVEIEWAPLAPPMGMVQTPIGFVDGVFDSPPVVNTINQPGVGAITAGNGLVLTGGTVTIAPPMPPVARIDDAVIAPGATAVVPIRLDNPAGPIDSVFLAFDVPDELILEDFDEGGSILEQVGAEFTVVDLTPDAESFSATLDNLPPFDGQTIPVGANQLLVVAEVTCAQTPLEPDPALSATLGWRTMPAASSVSIAGATVDLVTEEGTITCLPEPLADASFFAGVLEPGGTVGAISAAPGDIVEWSFYYTDPSAGVGGIQIAACLDCSIARFVPGSFSAIGDALDESEFLEASIDADPLDGDACEFTLGALLDSLPPFDDATLPFTSTPERLCRLEIEIDANVAAGAVIDVPFCDGINGTGLALISNVVLVDGASLGNFTRVDGQITLDQGTAFRRGDSNGDGTLNIADPIATLGYLFGGGAEPACLASADIDASGTIQLNDPILHLGHIFAGGPPPEAPYPDCGVSPGEPCDISPGC